MRAGDSSCRWMLQAFWRARRPPPRSARCPMKRGAGQVDHAKRQKPQTRAPEVDRGATSSPRGHMAIAMGAYIWTTFPGKLMLL